MDSISPVSAIGATHAVDGSAAAIKVPYGASLGHDINSFNASMEDAKSRLQQDDNALSSIAKAALEPLEHINNEAQSLGDYAKVAVESGNSLTPSEIISLTVQSQKFMFHSQLVANIANRSADGIQQLFRQQG